MWLWDNGAWKLSGWVQFEDECSQTIFPQKDQKQKSRAGESKVDTKMYAWQLKQKDKHMNGHKAKIRVSIYSLHLDLF